MLFQDRMDISYYMMRRISLVRVSKQYQCQVLIVYLKELKYCMCIKIVLNAYER